MRCKLYESLLNQVMSPTSIFTHASFQVLEVYTSCSDSYLQLLHTCYYTSTTIQYHPSIYHVQIQQASPWCYKPSFVNPLVFAACLQRGLFFFTNSFSSNKRISHPQYAYHATMLIYTTSQPLHECIAFLLEVYH